MSWKSENEVYEYIGRFNVEFEAFCASATKLSKLILSKHGLNNEGMLNSLVAGQTVSPTLDQAQRLISSDISGHEKTISKVFNRLRKPIEFRNQLIHAEYWMFGFNNEETSESEIQVTATKHHASKSGGSILKIKVEKSEIDQMISICYESRLIVALLSRCVVGVRSIDECFRINGKNIEINFDALKPVAIKGTK